MVACVLALLVVAPTVGASICLCDTSVAVSQETATVAHADQQKDKAPCEAACCANGHCHHGGPLLHPLAASFPTPAPAVAAHASAAAHALASVTPSGPDRPPRA